MPETIRKPRLARQEAGTGTTRERMSEAIRFNVEPSRKAQIEAVAEDAYRSVADYVRAVVYRELDRVYEPDTA